jgi:hypothetical protein
MGPLVEASSDLRSHVHGSSTAVPQLLPIPSRSSKPEIAQLEVAIAVYEDVFGLQVPIHHSNRVV